jgi:hypothetical protein
MFFAYRGYKISMAVRQICFIAADVLGGHGPGDPRQPRRSQNQREMTGGGLLRQCHRGPLLRRQVGRRIQSARAGALRCAGRIAGGNAAPETTVGVTKS